MKTCLKSGTMNDGEYENIKQIIRLREAMQEAQDRLKEISSNAKSIDLEKDQQEITNLVTTIKSIAKAEDEMLEKMKFSLQREYNNKKKSKQFTDGLSKDQLIKYYDDFINSELTGCNPPYPLLCGKRIWPENYVIPFGSFVCYNADGIYYLGLVTDLYSDDPDKYQVLRDVSLKKHNFHRFKVSKDLVIPLLKYIPNEIGSEYDFQVGDQILFITPNSNYWPEFQQGEIISLPKTRRHHYVVKTKEGSQIVVNPKYIIMLPESPSVQ